MALEKQYWVERKREAIKEKSYTIPEDHSYQMYLLWMRVSTKKVGERKRREHGLLHHLFL